MTAPPRDPLNDAPMSIDEAIAVLRLHNPNTRVVDCYSCDGVTTTAIQTCCPMVDWVKWNGETVADVIVMGLQLQAGRRARGTEEMLRNLDQEIIDDLRGIVT